MKPIPPPLLDSPTFLLVALVAGHATGDAALVRLAGSRLADLGIRVTFDRPSAAAGKAMTGGR